MTLPGALDTPAFLVDRRAIRCPVLRPGQLVVLDNLSVHQAAEADRLIVAAGGRLLVLRPDSPDFSPSEMAFAHLKAFLRSVAARTQAALDQAITAALAVVTPADAAADLKQARYRSVA